MQDFSEFAARERAGWADSGVVSAYVEKFGPVTDQIARDLVARAAPGGRTVLDLCCGQGSLTAMLVEAGAEATGLDFSDEMLARARTAAPDAAFVRGDAGALPFPEASFDQVLCNFGMMHLPDQPAALAEIRRVLRPGGRFLMATWAAPDVSPAFGTVFSAVRGHADMSRAPAQPDLFLFARPADAGTMMQAAGLGIVSHEIVPAVWELSEPGALFDIFRTATVAAAQLIRSQTPEVIGAMRDQITRSVAERFAEGRGFRVPVTVAVVTATA